MTEHEEGQVTREVVVEQSPIPRSVTILVVIMLVLSFAYIVYQQQQRNSDNQRFNTSLSQQVSANKVVVDRLHEQQQIITANEHRLEALVLAIANAKTSGQAQRAIAHFLHQAAKADQHLAQPSSTTTAPTPASTSAPVSSTHPSGGSGGGHPPSSGGKHHHPGSGKHPPKPSPSPSGPLTPVKSVLCIKTPVVKKLC